MTRTTKILVIALIVVIVGYHVYVASIKKDILKKLGSSNNQIKNDLDKLTLPELRHFDKLIAIYVDVKDKQDAPAETKMKSMEEMTALLADPKMKSIIRKTDGLKTFSGILSPAWISEAIK